jgi:hypothetical protein
MTTMTWGGALAVCGIGVGVGAVVVVVDVDPAVAVVVVVAVLAELQAAAPRASRRTVTGTSRVA